MAVRTKDEILEDVKTILGDNASDEALAFIENVSDTMTELETRATDTTNWKQKYEDNDKEWRDKYKNRFFNGSSQEEDENEFHEEETPMMTFDDLFKPKEGN